MNNTDYSPAIIDHFTKPRNVGEVKDADGVGEVGNPMCGDMMKLTIKVDKNDKGEEILSDIKFKTFGCAAAIATSSMTTELAKGKTLQMLLGACRQSRCIVRTWQQMRCRRR